MFTSQTLNALRRNLLSFFRRKKDTGLPDQRRSTLAVSKPMHVAFLATAIAALAGVTGVGLPAEDLFRAVRAQIRSHEAPPDIVVVTVDDKTLSALGTGVPDRKDDAKLIDTLFAAGANRVFFDMAYAEATNPDSDKAFAEALARHEEVYLGIAPAVDDGVEQFSEIGPMDEFSQRSKIASMAGVAGRSGLSYRLPTSAVINGQAIPSISAGLAGYKGSPTEYRLDFGIIIRSIKQVSYVDVLTGQHAPNQFKNAAVVVGRSGVGFSKGQFASLYSRIPDYFDPIQGQIPGVYLHALGGLTLRQGVPIDLGWVPALLLSAALVVWQARNLRPNRRLNKAAVAALLVIPLVMDYASISIDVFPALLCLGIGSARFGAARTQNARRGEPRPSH